MERGSQDAVGRSLQLLATVTRQLGVSLGLGETLDAIAQAVTSALGFGVAVVNLVHGDEVAVVAVAGGADVHAALHGTRSPLAAWRQLIASGERAGSLCFLDHRFAASPQALGVASWAPPLPDGDDSDPERWHRDDQLLALLEGPDGELLGAISVDMPDDGRKPSLHTCQLLEVFAASATVAIRHAREHDALQASETMLRRMFDESAVGLVLVGTDGIIRDVNDAFCTMLGRSREQFLGHRTGRFTHPGDQTADDVLDRVMADPGRRAHKVDKRYVHADGSIVWGRLSISRFTAGGGEELVLAQIEDITDARAAADALRHQALHDALTGLPNRTLVHDRIEHALATGRRTGSGVAVVFCDLDHFKLVNDSHGHQAGDTLLRHIASTLLTQLRPDDTAARIGGDEFVLVLPGVSTVAEATTIAERLRDAVRTPLSLGAATLTPTLSMGVTVGLAGSDAEQLLAEADSALYRAKALGRDRCEGYDGELREEAMRQLQLRAELGGAVERREFTLYYQPIITLDERRVVGYEALLRWVHPQRGVVLPGEFLPLLVDNAHDDTLTALVLEQACRDIQELPGDPDGGEPPFVSVNISVRQLLRTDLVAQLASVLRRTGLSPDRLWVEITEEHAVGLHHAAILEQVRQLGVHLAIDDFGTGYAGLTSFQKLPADVVKVDREFVARLDNDSVSRGIVGAVTNLAALLGLRVVGEGVETEVQAKVLAALGVELAQGYLFGRPAPASSWRMLAPGAMPRPRVPTDDVLRALDVALREVADVQQGSGVVLDALLAATATDGGTVVLRASAQTVRTMASRGYPAAVVERFREFGLDADLPVTAAMRELRPVWVDNVDTFGALSPQEREQVPMIRLLAVPLVGADGTVLGAAGVSWSRGASAPADGAAVTAIAARFADWLDVRRRQVDPVEQVEQVERTDACDPTQPSLCSTCRWQRATACRTVATT